MKLNHLGGKSLLKVTNMFLELIEFICILIGGFVLFVISCVFLGYFASRFLLKVLNTIHSCIKGNNDQEKN